MATTRMAPGAISAEIMGGFALGTPYAHWIYKSLPHFGTTAAVWNQARKARELGWLEPDPNRAASKGHKSPLRLSEAFYVRVLESFLTDASEAEKGRWANDVHFQYLVRHAFGCIALGGRFLDYRPSVDEVISVLSGIAQYPIEANSSETKNLSNFLEKSIERRKLSVVTIVQQSLFSSREELSDPNADALTYDNALQGFREDFELKSIMFRRGDSYERA